MYGEIMTFTDLIMNLNKVIKFGIKRIKFTLFS